MSGTFAVISDIHSNLLALEAVLRQLEDDKPDAIFCLGDVVGYGAEPNECIELVRSVADGRTLLGNHDVATLQVYENYEEWFNPDAKLAVQYQRDVLSQENMAWLGALPESHSEKGCLFYHGSPIGTNHYLLSTSDLRAALEHLDDDQEFKILFTGHTHVPIVVEISPDGSMTSEIEKDDTVSSDIVIYFKPEKRYMVNPGSVGQPRDRKPTASYALVDIDIGKVRLRRAVYNTGEARRRIMAAGLPEFLGYRIEHGM